MGLLADGWSYAAVAKAFHHDPATVKRWWRKAKKHGVRSLLEAPRSGRPSKLPPDVRTEVARAIKRQPSAVNDVNGDGGVNTVYVQIVSNSVLNLGCKANYQGVRRVKFPHICGEAASTAQE